MIKKNTLLFLLTSIILDINASSTLLNLPEGFQIDILAKDLNSPRQIAETGKGHIIVGSKKGNEVVALVDKNKNGIYEKVTVASGLELSLIHI